MKKNKRRRGPLRVRLTEYFGVYPGHVAPPLWGFDNDKVTTEKIGDMFANIYHGDEEIIPELFTEIDYYKRNIFAYLQIDRAELEEYLQGHCVGYSDGAVFMKGGRKKSVRSLPFCEKSFMNGNKVTDFLCKGDGAGEPFPCILAGFDFYEKCKKKRKIFEHMSVRETSHERIYPALGLTRKQKS